MITKKLGIRNREMLAYSPLPKKGWDIKTRK